jgi:SAM-dependent methyltransferase
LFHLGRVVSVDIEDRFLHSLDIETKLFNGQSLPFDDGSFDCIMLFNVLHHVLPGQRALLLRECRRVVGQGPIYIKDHLSHGIIDNARLAALDLMGNLPFKGMLSARYLRAAEWEKLAACSKSVAAPFGLSQYRSGLFQIIFPNRLEVVTRWSNEAASRA